MLKFFNLTVCTCATVYRMANTNVPPTYKLYLKFNNNILMSEVYVTVIGNWIRCAGPDHITIENWKCLEPKRFFMVD